MKPKQKTTVARQISEIEAGNEKPVTVSLGGEAATGTSPQRGGSYAY